jgi:hypothetical protein
MKVYRDFRNVRFEWECTAARTHKPEERERCLAAVLSISHQDVLESEMWFKGC